MLKKIVVSCIFLLCFFSLIGESYKIETVEYNLKGLTREGSFKEKIPVDTTTLFTDEESLLDYLKDLETLISNQRVFDSSSVEIVNMEEGEEYTKVSILITTKDTWNIIALPYPSYDSNSGFTLKLKIKDYNFLGSMETFDCTANYKYTASKHHDIDFSFSVPFPTFNFLSFNSTFGMDFKIAYTYGDSSPSFTFGQNFGMNKKLNDILSVNIGLTNIFYINPDYEKYDDKFYFKDTVSVSIPIILAKIKNIGNLTWSPKVSLTYNWDFDAFKGINNGGLKNPSLHGPTITVSHSISTGRVNWDGNFRKGFNFSVSQSLDYNINNKTIYPYFNFNSSIFHKFNNYVGLATRQNLFINVAENNSQKGGLLRGIKNNYLYSNSGLILNFDLPIKIIQTDWVSWFNTIGLNWNWTRLFDFEFQLNPFFDMALCKNPKTGTQFLIEDGFYSCGIEMLVYPNRMKSIVGRVSLGVDAVKTLDKIGNKISFVDKITNKLFNTEWRDGSAWELFIGIGLFY